MNGNTIVQYPALDTEIVEKPSMYSRADKPLILLVDDEVVMQELGQELLEAHGFSVLLAGDGIEAVDLYRRYWSEIALVILDLLMPKLDGGQAYLELKRINRHVKAFFCTAYNPEDIIGSVLDDERLTAVQKPFHPAEFIRTVNEMIPSQ